MKQYLIISSVYLAVFYIMYILLLNNDTLYRRNRLYLLSGILISLVLPLVRIDIAGFFSTFNENIDNIFIIEQVNISSAGNSTVNGSNIPSLFEIYLGGCIISFIIVCYNIIKLLNLISRYRVKDSKIVLTPPGRESGFSALGFIFLSSDLPEEAREIIKEHEQNHISNRHFIDILLLRAAGIILWFNPFIYLYDRSLKAVHEYEADEKMLGSGNNIISYQKLILNQIFSTSIFTLQNGFSGPSLIKKRMIMMTKKRSKKSSGLKLLLAVPVILLTLGFFSCSGDEAEQLEPADKTEVPGETEFNFTANDKQDEPAESAKSKFAEDAIFVVVEEMPKFMGGDVNLFRNWVQNNVIYPEIAIENGIQGKVYIMFVVEPDGSVSNASIVRGVDPSLDNEVTRVVESSPLWTPGKQRGKTVRVRYSITINFQLQ